jgi:hypothetical protein
LGLGVAVGRAALVGQASGVVFLSLGALAPVVGPVPGVAD